MGMKKAKTMKIGEYQMPYIFGSGSGEKMLFLLLVLY